MAENVTLAPVSSFTNDGSAVATVNANYTLIETALEDCVSLSGTQPNQMQSNLDMGQFQIVNLPPPNNLLSPVRLLDLANVTNSVPITVNTLPTGGSTNAVLHKNSGTNYDATWTLTPSGLTSIGATSSTVTTSNITGTAVLSGATSGTTTVQATAIASGTLTLPATTDTLIGKATTDTLTNKTLDSAGTGNSIKVNGTALTAVTGTGSVVLATSPSITTPAISGVTDGSSAASGKVGEYQESVIASGSAVSMTTATAKNITSLTLPAGDWDVSGNISYVASVGAQTFHYYSASLSTTTGTIDQTNGRFTLSGGSADTFTSGSINNTIAISVGPVRFSSNGSTTIFLIGQISFATSGTNAAYGILRARRVH